MRLASVLALVALALIVWGLIDPHAAPVLAGLTLGQGLGTGSFLLYLLVVASDLHLRRRLQRAPGASDAP